MHLWNFSIFPNRSSVPIKTSAPFNDQILHSLLLYACDLDIMGVFSIVPHKPCCTFKFFPHNFFVPAGLLTLAAFIFKLESFCMCPRLRTHHKAIPFDKGLT